LVVSVGGDEVEEVGMDGVGVGGEQEQGGEECVLIGSEGMVHGVILGEWKRLRE